MLRPAYILLIVLALALGACGDDDDDSGNGGGGGDAGGETVSADQYAGDICESTQTWVEDLQKRASDLQGSLGTNVSPQEGKDALAGFLDDVLTDTDKWIEAVNASGTPDVDGGEQSAEEFRNAAEEAKGVLEDTAESVDNLPTDSEEAFSRETTKVGEATEESLKNVGDAISTPDSDELQKAFQDNKTCQELGA